MLPDDMPSFEEDNDAGLGSYDILENKINEALREIEKKLANYREEGVLLIIIDPLLSIAETEILQSIKNVYHHINRFYAIGKLDHYILRIW